MRAAHFITKALGLGLVVLSSTALSFVDPPRIVPERPSTESIVHTTIRAGICDTFFTVGPEDRELEISGNQISLKMRGLTTEDLAQCIYPPGEFIYLIGQLPAGNYHLNIFIKQVQFPGQVDLVQTGSFVVEGSSSVPIPTMNFAASLFLLASLGGAGLFVMSSRRS